MPVKGYGALIKRRASNWKYIFYPYFLKKVKLFMTSGRGGLTDKQLVMKFDFNGNLLWSKKYNEGIFGKCVKNNSGGIVCLGTTQDTTVLMSLDENGNQLWKNNFRSFALSYSNDLVVTNDSGYAFVCEARYSSVLAYVVKTKNGQLHS